MFPSLSQAASVPAPPPENDTLLIGQVGIFQGCRKATSKSPPLRDTSSVSSRFTISEAARNIAKTFPDWSAKAFRPQQPQAPVGLLVASFSRPNVFPSSVDFAKK